MAVSALLGTVWVFLLEVEDASNVDRQAFFSIL